MIAALGLATSLSACATVPPPGVDGYAALGQTTRAGPLLVRPDAVREDSRCAANVQCVWAGRVVVDATVREDGRSTVRTLVLGEPALTQAGELVLDGVAPQTQADTPIPARAYRFHLTYRPRVLD